MDINSESAGGRSAWDLIRVLLLQKREDLTMVWEDYWKKQFQSRNMVLHFVKARLLSLLLEMSGFMQRKFPAEWVEYNNIVKGNCTAEQLWLITNHLYKILDDLRITKFDLAKIYDRQSFEAENQAHDL